MLLITIQFVSHLVVSAISFPSPNTLQKQARQATRRDDEEWSVRSPQLRSAQRLT